MTVNELGKILVKADRINDRIAKAGDKLFHDKQVLTRHDFNEFIKTAQLIVSTELTEKGAEREWKA